MLLCPQCRGLLVAAPNRVVAGVVVRSAWAHEGAARRLVHRLKYHGLASAATPVVERLVEVLRAAGDEPSALIPLPRARLRRGIHGVDPAAVIAAELGAALGVPVIRAIHAGWWWPRHARPGSKRLPPRLTSLRRRVPPGAAFVDDVVTTGATLEVAASMFPEVALAYTATSRGRFPVR